MRSGLPRFWIAFFATLIAVGGLTACLIADAAARETAFPQRPAFLEVRPGEDAASRVITCLGKEYHISWQWINQGVGVVQQLSGFLPVQAKLQGKLASLAMTRLWENITFTIPDL